MDMSLLIDFIDMIGEILMIDDMQDIGKFDRIHHWHIGAILKNTASAIQFIELINEVINNG